MVIIVKQFPTIATMKFLKEFVQSVVSEPLRTISMDTVICGMKLTYVSFSIVKGPQGTLQAANKDQGLYDTVGKPGVGSNFKTVIIQFIFRCWGCHNIWISYMYSLMRKKIVKH